jgi:hypothetical protein
MKKVRLTPFPDPSEAIVFPQPECIISTKGVQRRFSNTIRPK